jgi:hypothetical protein
MTKVKISKTYEVRDDCLVCVRRYLVDGARKYDYPKIEERVEVCDEYLTFMGMDTDATSVIQFLLTGKWGKKTLRLKKE